MNTQQIESLIQQAQGGVDSLEDHAEATKTLLRSMELTLQTKKRCVLLLREAQRSPRDPREIKAGQTAAYFAAVTCRNEAHETMYCGKVPPLVHIDDLERPDSPKPIGGSFWLVRIVWGDRGPTAELYQLNMMHASAIGIGIGLSTGKLVVDLEGLQVAAK